MNIFGRLVHIFGQLVHIFGKLVHIFARKLVSRTSKQVFEKLGPLWQPGVYNDTNHYSTRKRPECAGPCDSVSLLSECLFPRQKTGLTTKSQTSQTGGKESGAIPNPESMENLHHVNIGLHAVVFPVICT